MQHYYHLISASELTCRHRSSKSMQLLLKLILLQNVKQYGGQAKIFGFQFQCYWIWIIYTDTNYICSYKLCTKYCL
jgi:hypothetical protein